MRFRAIVDHSFSNTSAFAAAIEKAAEPQVRQMMQETADEAARIANEIVAKEFNTARAPGRRKPGPHLAGSFRGEVVGGGGGKVVGTIRLRSTAAAVKVNSLNSGSVAHEIGADGRTLAFPGTTSAGGYKRSAAFIKQRKSAKAGRSVVVKGPVQHPGTIGSHFMERAMERAVRARLRTAVTIPRR
jgi:hypothetical protein